MCQAARKACVNVDRNKKACDQVDRKACVPYGNKSWWASGYVPGGKNTFCVCQMDTKACTRKDYIRSCKNDVETLKEEQILSLGTVERSLCYNFWGCSTFQRKRLKPMSIVRKRTLTYYYLAMHVYLCIRSWQLERECYCADHSKIQNNICRGKFIPCLDNNKTRP